MGGRGKEGKPLRDAASARIRRRYKRGPWMKKLSLSQAWDESRAVLARDGRLLGSVALALVVLPQTIIGLIAPASAGEPSSLTLTLLGITGIIGMIAQIAINRLAIGPSITVGAAIGRGFTRMPALLGSFLLLVVALFLILIPIVLLLGVAGLIAEPAAGNEAPAGFLLLILLLAALGYAIFQLTIPVAAAETGGSIHLLTRSWRLSRGNYWRLLAFVLLLFACLIVVLIAGQYGLGAMIAVALGPPEALSLSALVISLVVALIQALFMVIFAVMLARIYVQLAGAGEAQPSVPSSGT